MLLPSLLSLVGRAMNGENERAKRFTFKRLLRIWQPKDVVIAFVPSKKGGKQ